MAFKKHTGITFTLIGILLPFFGSVCLASAGAYNSFLSSTHQYEKTISFQKDETPVSKSMVKQDIDFIHRFKNDRFLSRNFPALNGSLLNYPPHPGFSLSQIIFVPKPGYYNFLFMFKPF